MGRLLAILLGLLALAGAAAAEPVRASVTLQEPLRIQGDVHGTASSGLADLSPLLAQGTLLAVEWEAAQGYLAGVETWRFANGAYSQPTKLPHEGWPNETIQAGAGRLEDLVCKPGCRAYLLAAAPGAAFRWNATWSGQPVAQEPEARTFAAGAPGDLAGGSAPDGFFFESGQGWLALPSDAGPLHATGPLQLVLHNVSGTLVADGASRPFETGGVDEEERAALGQRVMWRHRNTTLVLDLTGGRVKADAMPPVLAPAWSLHVEGRIWSPAASGWASGWRERQTLDGTALAASGSLDLDLAVDEKPEGALGGSSPSPVTMAVRGDAQWLMANGVRIAGDDARAERVAAWGALLILLFAWRLARSGILSPLYSRIPSSRVLDNQNRARILQAIRESPGSTLAALAERTAIHETLVGYHVRRLATAGLVRVQEEGRWKAVFPVDAEAPRLDPAVRIALRGDRRLLVARDVAAAASGITQGDLVQRTGLSQRLVSYHLSELAKAGLLRVEEGRPTRYHPTATLAEALRGGSS